MPVKILDISSASRPKPENFTSKVVTTGAVMARHVVACLRLFPVPGRCNDGRALFNLIPQTSPEPRKILLNYC